jgi:hypothetical protein
MDKHGSLGVLMLALSCVDVYRHPQWTTEPRDASVADSHDEAPIAEPLRDTTLAETTGRTVEISGSTSLSFGASAHLAGTGTLVSST